MAQSAFTTGPGGSGSSVNTASFWLRFVSGGGTITNSFNVASITTLNTGQDTINFTNPMLDSNYLTLGSTQIDTGSAVTGINVYSNATVPPYRVPPTTMNCSVYTFIIGASASNQLTNVVGFGS